MACIAQFANTVGYWTPIIQDAFTVAPQASYLANWGLSAPAQGEPNWRTWNVQQLDHQQCIAAATEARAAADWEHFRAIALGVAGVLASAVVYAVMLAVAGAILAGPLYVLTALSAYLESISVVLDCVISIPGFVCWDILLIRIAARIAAYAPRLWTKELLPAITRTWNNGDHLAQEATRLELRAAQLNAWA